MTRSVDCDRAPRPLALLATVAGNVYLVLGSLVMATLGLMLARIPPHGRYYFRCARWWARGWLAASGVRVRGEAEAPLHARGPYVFMANHLSYYDIPVLMATLPVEARFVAKQSLFRLPVVGRSMRAGGFVPVDRQDRSGARDSFGVALRELGGASIVIFPEGTRSLTGELQELQRGGFLMALRSRRPIVPVGIDGTYHVQPRGRHWIEPGRVTVRYGRPIDVSGHGVRARAGLARTVAAEIDRLTRGARGGVRAPDDSPAAGEFR